MTVRVVPWSKGPAKGWEIDIRFTWPEGGRYRARVKSPVSGRDGSVRWGLRREAELLRAGRDAVAKKAEQESDSRGAHLVPTLAEFKTRFLADYATANGHHQAGIDGKEAILRLHLLPHLGDRTLNEIRTSDVQRLKAIYREGIRDEAGAVKIRPTQKAKTINNRLTVLNKLLKVACEWGELPSMPCTVRLLKVADQEALFLEQEVLDRFVAAATKIGPAALTMLLLGSDAGLRRGEIIGLNWADIDFERRQICVQRHIYKGKEGPTKGGKPRYVPMTQMLVHALAKQRHLRGPRVLYFERFGTGDWLQTTPKILKRWMLMIEKEAGALQTGRLHVLRHTFCSRLAMANAPVRTIQELAGHASLSTTLRYMHLARGAKNEAIALLDRRANVARHSNANS